MALNADARLSVTFLTLTMLTKEKVVKTLRKTPIDGKILQNSKNNLMFDYGLKASLTN